MPNLQVKDATGATQTVQTLPAVGQGAMAASLPVAIASDQGPIPVSLGGASTNRVSYSGNITSATTTSAIAAQGVGEFTYITDIDLFNAGTTSVLVQIENSTPAVLWEAFVPAGGGVTKAFQTPVGGNGQMTANTAISIVTGTGTTSLYANLNGYKSVS
jgi:hypothetical protein